MKTTSSPLPVNPSALAPGAVDLEGLLRHRRFKPHRLLVPGLAPGFGGPPGDLVTVHGLNWTGAVLPSS